MTARRPAPTAVEARGIAAWLIEHTAVTFEQIARYTGVHPLEVKLIADDGYVPHPQPIDPLYRGWLVAEEINRCERDAEAWLARPLVWISASLKRCSPATIRDFPVTSAMLSRVAFLFYGRNAWHSTWIERYYTEDSIALFIDDLKRVAENKRVQGSVFNIEEIPCLVLIGEDDTLIATEINRTSVLLRYAEVFNGPLFAKRILRAYAGAPENSVIWLRLGERVSPAPLDTSRGFQRLTSYSRGSGYLLGWRKHEQVAASGETKVGTLLAAVEHSLPLTAMVYAAGRHLPKGALDCPSEWEVTVTKEGICVTWHEHSVQVPDLDEP